MRTKTVYVLYFVFDDDVKPIFIGTVTTDGEICPSEQAPDPRNESWWQTRAKYVLVGAIDSTGLRLSKKAFEEFTAAYPKQRRKELRNDRGRKIQPHH